MRGRRWGKIVNLSSMGGRLTFPGGGFYHASKHALEALSDALRFEVAGFGIDVIVIEPGLIPTRFAETAAAGIASSTGVYADFNRSVSEQTVRVYQGALGCLGGTPETVARTI